MRPNTQALTNVALIRDYRGREARPPAVDPARSREAGAIEHPDVAVARLIERWHAPVVSEEEIEAWAARYRLCPKSGMSFVEYLIVRGVGHLT